MLPVVVFDKPGTSIGNVHIESVESSSFFFIVLRRELCVYHEDSLTSKRVIMRTELLTKCFVPLQKLR